MAHKLNEGSCSRATFLTGRHDQTDIDGWNAPAWQNANEIAGLDLRRSHISRRNRDPSLVKHHAICCREIICGEPSGGLDLVLHAVPVAKRQTPGETIATGDEEQIVGAQLVDRPGPTAPSELVGAKGIAKRK
nr:hypothetical protein [Mesorhizobium loti]